MIRVVAFDLDDTLWAVDPVIRRAEARLGSWLTETIEGLQYEPEEINIARAEVLQRSPDLIQRVTSFRHEVLQTLLRNHGIAPERARLVSDEAMEVFLVARNEINYFEGALEALAAIAGQFTLGALTNGNADINRLGLAELFSFAFSAEEVGAAKPAPDLFLKALAHTGCEPSEMVYVGDDPIKDVDGANAVGLKTIWVRNSLRGDPGNSSPDCIIDHIRELPAALERLSQSRL